MVAIEIKPTDKTPFWKKRMCSSDQADRGQRRGQWRARISRSERERWGWVTPPNYAPLLAAFIWRFLFFVFFFEEHVFNVPRGLEDLTWFRFRECVPRPDLLWIYPPSSSRWADWRLRCNRSTPCTSGWWDFLRETRQTHKEGHEFMPDNKIWGFLRAGREKSRCNCFLCSIILSKKYRVNKHKSSKSVGFSDGTNIISVTFLTCSWTKRLKKLQIVFRDDSIFILTHFHLHLLKSCTYLFWLRTCK